MVLTAAAIIAFLTLRPAPPSIALPASCIFCGELGGLDFILNVGLFVPFGTGLCWLMRRSAIAVAIGFATSLAIETLQWRVITGRDASLGDLLANTIGAMAGAWLAVDGIRWLGATRAEARRFAGVSAVLVSAVVVGSSWLVQPAQTRVTQFVQWKPVRRNMEPFQGHLSSVEFNGAALRPAQVLREPETRNTRTVSVRAEFSGSIPVTHRPAFIIRLAGESEEGFALLQWGTAVAFRSHMVASRLKLRPLLGGLQNGFATPGVGSGENGGELIIEAQSNSRMIKIDAVSTSTRTSLTLRRSVGLAWATMLPREVALNDSWWPANAAWLGMLVLPVAFFTMRTRRSTFDDSTLGFVWWPIALVVAVLAAVPMLNGLSALSVGEWTGVLAGILAGATIEQWFFPNART